MGMDGGGDPAAPLDCRRSFAILRFMDRRNFTKLALSGLAFSFLADSAGRAAPLGETQPQPAVPPVPRPASPGPLAARSEEHTSELQSLMRISYAVFCLKKKTNTNSLCSPTHTHPTPQQYITIHLHNTQSPEIMH